MGNNVELDYRAIAYALDWCADVFWNTPAERILSSFDQSSFLSAGVAEDRVARLALAVLSLGSDDGIADAKVDYAALFATADPQTPYPYESIYADSERLLMRPCRDDMAETYRKAGFDCSCGEAIEPEDHLSCELRFAAYLVRSAHELKVAPRRGDRAVDAESFARNHLARWVGKFCDEVQRKAQSDLYRVCAAVVDDLVELILAASPR